MVYMRKSGVAEMYVRALQEDSGEVSCGCDRVQGGGALSPFLFALVTDRMTEDVRHESPWTLFSLLL